MADVLLISAQQNLDTIGLKYIHQYLIENGFDSLLLYIPNFTKQKGSDRLHLEKFLREVNPPIVGISLTVEDYPVACEVTKIIKKVLPNTSVIWGGIEPTTEPERCLQHADFVCMGEGEIPLREAVEVMKKGGDLKI